MEAETQPDDSTELRINGDASDVTRLEAERIHENTDYNVTVNAHRRNKKAKIVVYWQTERDQVNGYHKASVINNVLNCPASVELHGTDDGSHAVVFKAR